MRSITITFLLTLTLATANAQEKADSAKTSLTAKAFRAGLKLVSTNPTDTIVNVKSTDNFAQYTGKIIRKIFIERFGFEKSIYDTTKKVTTTITKLANALHSDTRERTIRQHILFEKYQRLNPYELADNERFIRDKDFILDCRIVVIPVEGTDSVDISVITRDVFSLGATIGGSFPTAPKIGLYDANIFGKGQRLEFTALLDQDRSPKFGYAVSYKKSSLLGTLTNIELQYTQINTGISVGDESEFAFLGRLNRPLVSPYLRLAGGLEVSRNWSSNVYNEPDSTFLDYEYKIFNSWIGYNIGIKKASASRGRQFLAVRYFDGYYLDAPDLSEDQREPRYSSGYGYLAEFSFYKQNYYKTRYVFGFGRTEDIPYGISIGITGGYVREVEVERPYGAFKIRFADASKKGNFYRLSFQSGGYFRDGGLEDFIIQGTSSYFTRALNVSRSKFRAVLGADYTQLLNRNVSDWLKMSNNYIPGFSADSVIADKRLTLNFQSVLYTPLAILGFRMAPFTEIDMVMVNCKECRYQRNSYWGLSAGLRTRNENLIFGTIEVKATYIPQDEYGKSKFVFGFRQNLRVKNTGTFASEPTLIRYNQ
ncbi:hypothetical protein WBG78_07500 [Chryseolinea sp. T2]|uniref:hypothetical protein n=1 Tax=Chryseolinea sp. T2 TaxID=3129255 RepID=UPI00307761A0